MNNIDKFKGNQNSEFEKILSNIIDCYYLMIKKEKNLKNDENYISDIFHQNYLNNNKVRKKINNLNNYLFEREAPENNIGRIDFKILTKNSFEDTTAYYIIECKRLDNKNQNGKNGLNNKYINEGIKRFTDGKYKSFKKENGMIGFVVENMDIDKNINHINNLLKHNKEINTRQFLKNKFISNNFKFSYISTHNSITLYHLMLDLSNNIQQNILYENN